MSSARRKCAFKRSDPVKRQQCNEHTHLVLCCLLVDVSGAKTENRAEPFLEWKQTSTDTLTCRAVVTGASKPVAGCSHFYVTAHAVISLRNVCVDPPSLTASTQIRLVIAHLLLHERSCYHHGYWHHPQDQTSALTYKMQAFNLKLACCCMYTSMHAESHMVCTS